MAGAEESDSLRWPLMVAGALAVPEAISLLGMLLQRSRIGSPVPEELEGLYDLGEYETSNRYTKAKSNVGLLKDLYDLVIFYAFWFMHGFPWADAICASLGMSQIFTGLAFFAFVSFGFNLLDLPWDIYQTFVLEERFGFNKTTPWTFAKDRLKAVALMAALGGPLLYAVLWFFISAGPNAWLWVFVTLTTFQMVLLFLMPALILPLFMEMIPLPEGSALVTNKTGAGFPDFLSGRLFYSNGTSGDKPCWTTKDRRFAGTTAGSVLSICWQSTQWVIIEGEPDAGGATYATCASEALDSKTASDGLSWQLTSVGEAAVAQHSADGSAGEGGAAAKDPLVKEGLRTTCADVGSLRSKLLALADKLGYHGASIFVIDGSSRSEHSNAFCTGFGSFRRICLFDTLLPVMSEDEIVAVLGHEIGHDRLYHVHTRLVFGIAYSFIMLYALGQFLTSSTISSAFFVPTPKVYVGMMLFSIVWSVVDFAVSIPLTVQSRMNEFAADRYAVEANGLYGPLLGSALKKLMKKSKANLTPHPFYVFLTYSHPPLDGRLKAIRAHQQLKHG